MHRGATSDHAPRLSAITGLRWWGAFAVFAHHLANFAPVPGLFGAYLAYGDRGVTFFFVLSGFVLTWSMRPDTDRRTFYWRRFARIYPLHLATLALAVPVFYSRSPDPAQWWVKPFDPGVLSLSIPLLQGWSRRTDVLFSGNPAAWTLSCEAFFYLLHPFMTRLLARLTRRGALLASAAVVGVALLMQGEAVLHPQGWVAGLPYPVLRLDEFVLGMCVAWAFRKGWRPRLPVSLAGAAALGWFAVLTVLVALRPSHWLTRLMSAGTPVAATVLFTALIVAVAASELVGRVRLLAARPFVVLGEWSYAFYLVHQIPIYVALALLGQRGGGWANLTWAALLVVLATGGAGALHLGVEKPIEARLRAWQARRREGRAAHRAEALAERPGSEAAAIGAPGAEQ